MLKVVILGMDKDNKRISLGIKQLDRDPWENIENDFTVGKIVKGTVSKVTSFGAFVRFESGVEGLVHISEISNKDVDNVEELIKVGQDYEFKVVRANKTERKLGLSLRAVSEPEETAKAMSREGNRGGQHDHHAGRSERSERPERSERSERSFDRSSRQDAQPKPRTESVNPLKGALQQALEEHMREGKK